MIKRFFKWIFKSELLELQKQINHTKEATKKYSEQELKIDNLLGNIDVSVDVHQYSKSWAVISIQGKKTDYIKFVDLGESEIRDIQMFLRNFDRRKIDASPIASRFLRIN